MDSISDLQKLSERVPEKVLPELATGLGLVWRNLVPGDAVRLRTLIGEIETADDAPFRTSIEEIEELFESNGSDFELNTTVAVGDDGEFLAYGLLHVPPGEETEVQVFMDGGVHPSVRELGIGQTLAAWLTARAHNMLREHDSTLPGVIAVYVQENGAKNWELFENCGFTARRYFKTLRRDLSQEVIPIEIAENFRVVPYDLELDDQVLEVHNDAFRDHGNSQPHTKETWLRTRAEFEPSWSFIVLDDDVENVEDASAVVGYIVVNKYSQDWESFGYSSGYVSMLGVRSDRRGQKLALAMLTQVIQVLKGEGVEFIELDVDSQSPEGSLGLYNFLGFTVASGSRMYSMEF